MKKNTEFLSKLMFVLSLASLMTFIACSSKEAPTIPPGYSEDAYMAQKMEEDRQAEEAKKNKNKKIQLGFNYSIPSVAYGEDMDILYINFNGSATDLENIGNEPSAEIEIFPGIPGKWVWESDTQLKFTPEESWQMNTHYKIDFPKTIFRENVVVKDKLAFDTGTFHVYSANSEFFVDPYNPNVKKVTFTIAASHPFDKSYFTPDNLTLTFHVLSEKARKGKKDTIIDQKLSYSVTYSEDGREAYILSDNVPIPPYTSTVELKMKHVNVLKSKTFLSDPVYSEVTVPGISDFVSIRSINHMLVKNEDQNYDQILTLSTKGKITTDEIAKHLTIYKLPKDRPENTELKIKYDKNHYWRDSDIYTQEVLAASEKIAYEVLPTEDSASENNTIRFKTDPESFLYCHLSKDMIFYGGYRYVEEYAEVERVKAYPVELGILSEGSILTLQGSKKMAMYSRGVTNVEYKLSRIMPKDVNHLISMSNGNMKNFDFSSGYYDDYYDDYYYRSSKSFNENNIAETKKSKYTIPGASNETISYFSYDFSNEIVPDAKRNLTNGLFIFSVSGNGKTDRRFILVTDIGFFTKRNSDSSVDVFVQKISSGGPVSGAEVTLVGLNGNTLMSAYTDSTGHAKLPSASDYRDEHRPIAYVVKTASDLSFMPYNDRGRTLDYSNFDIGGVYGSGKETKITGYVFSDRGIYRPGDQVNLGLIVKSGDWKNNMANLPIECEVFDSKGAVAYSDRFLLPASGFTDINFSTQSYSPTGVYTANIYRIYKSSNEERREFLCSSKIKVEEFQPDTLNISTSFEPLPKDGWLNPGKLNGVVSLKNLFGTPAAGNNIKASVKLVAGFPVLRNYSDYYFSDPFYKGNSFEESLPPMTTDEYGEAKFAIDIEKFERATYRLEFYAEGFEKGSGRSVSQQSSVYVSPLNYLIGYKADGSLSYINKKTERKISLIAIDQNLEKIDLKGVTLELDEIKYVNTLVKQKNGSYKYQSIKKNYPVSSKKIDISSDGTEFFLESDKAGEYVLSLVDENGLVFNKINYSIKGEENISRSLVRSSELEISLEQKEVKAGQNVDVFIKAPYEGSGLITIEKDKVYTWKWFKTKELSSVQTINIPSNVEGNVYINVMYMRDINSKEIFMSPFCYGAVSVNIDREKRTDVIKLDVPEEIKSGTPLEIKYSSRDKGKIVVFAVDEGILQVANYSMPDPLSAFLRKAALEVKTSQILDLVLPEYELLKEIGAIGGGAGMDELSRNLNPFKRKQNAPVVFWSGILDTDSSTRTVTYDVPDYFNGSIRVMAVSVSEDSVGVARTSTLANNTYIMIPNVPYASVPGDEFDVSVTLTNNRKGSGSNAAIKLTAVPNEKLQIVSPSSINLNVSEGKDATQSFRVKVLDMLGNAEIKFTATGGNESSSITSTLSVRPPMPYEVIVESGMSTKKSVDVPVNTNMYKDYYDGEVAVSTVPSSYEKGVTAFLYEYPYGCAEQVTSKAYPYLFDTILKGSHKTRDDAQKMVNATIAILQSRQKDDGNIGYWTNESSVQYWVTLYVADFVTDAIERGYYQPTKFYYNLMDALEEIALKGTSYERTYAIYLLTKNEIVTTSYIERLNEESWGIDYDYEGIYLAATYKMLKQTEKANRVLTKVRIRKQFDSSWKYHNNLQYISDYIHIIVTYFPEKLSAIKTNEVKELCSFMDYKYFNSYSCAAAIRAFESLAYVDKTDMYTASALKNNKVFSTINLEENASVMSGSFQIGTEGVQLTNSSELPMYYQTIVKGFENKIPEKAVKNGIDISREYVDANGKNLTSVKVGDDVYVKIHFKSQKGALENIAMVDMLPACLEADIDSIRKFSGDFRPDYVDIREDRVIVYTTFKEDVRTFTYKTKAITSGSFVVPPMFAEGMYDKELRAVTPYPKLEVKPAE